MNHKQAILILVTVLVMATALTGAAAAGKIQQELTGESTIENALKRGVLRVGMSTFVPWAMKDKTGKLVAFFNEGIHNRSQLVEVILGLVFRLLLVKCFELGRCHEALEQEHSATGHARIS